jgi:hypothetical protein
MIMNMFAVQDKAKLNIDLEVVKLTTIQVTKLPL